MNHVINGKQKEMLLAQYFWKGYSFGKKKKETGKQEKENKKKKKKVKRKEKKKKKRKKKRKKMGKKVKKERKKKSKAWLYQILFLVIGCSELLLRNVCFIDFFA